MSATALKKPLDPRKLAAQAARIEGQLAAATIPRFSAAVVGEFAPAEYKLRFERVYDGKVLVHGNVRVAVNLQCQRCMQPALYRLNTEFTVQPVFTDAQAAAMQKTADVVLLNEAGLLDGVALLEDELLLSLPIVMYHENTGCGASNLQFGEPKTGRAETARPNNPFAILAQNRQPTEE